MTQRCRNTYTDTYFYHWSSKRQSPTHTHRSTKCHICTNIHIERCILLLLKSQETVFDTHLHNHKETYAHNIPTHTYRTEHVNTHMTKHMLRLPQDRYTEYRNRHAHTQRCTNTYTERILVIKVPGGSHGLRFRHTHTHTQSGMVFT